MRNNRNVRTGMNRTGFVRAVGAGAAGFAGAAMMGSGVAKAYETVPPGLLSNCERLIDENKPAALMDSCRELLEQETYNAVIARGYLVVAIPSLNVTGMFEGWPAGTINEGVTMTIIQSNAASGLEADMARCVAVALWGEYNNRVVFIGSGAASRFVYLATKKVDVVFRAATWTASRDIYNTPFTIGPGNPLFPDGVTVPAQGYDFCPTYYHDGGNIAMDPDRLLSNADEEGKVTIRIATNDSTTTYAGAWNTLGSGLSSGEVLARIKQKYEEIIMEHVLTVSVQMVFLNTMGGLTFTQAYQQNLLDGIINDGSGLIEFLNAEWAETLFDQAIGNEALSPIVRQGDSHWKDLVSYAAYVPFAADDGWYPPSTTFNSNLVPNNPNWATDILTVMGNYTSIWEYSLTGIPRGNNLTPLNGGRLWYPALR